MREARGSVGGNLCQHSETSSLSYQMQGNQSERASPANRCVLSNEHRHVLISMACVPPTVCVVTRQDDLVSGPQTDE
jgi:hypothetical protein